MLESERWQKFRHAIWISDIVSTVQGLQGVTSSSMEPSKRYGIDAKTRLISSSLFDAIKHRGDLHVMRDHQQRDVSPLDT